MAITIKRQPWLYSTDDHQPPEIRAVKIAATQTYIEGSPGYINTSGQAKIAATSNGAPDSFHFFFLAAAAAAATANVEVNVVMIRATQIWCIYLETNDSDQAASQAHVGNVYGCVVQTTPSTQKGYMTVDVNEGSHTVVKVVDIMPNVEPSMFTTSDTQGVALVRFLQANIDATTS